MKIIDQTPFFKENGELSLMDRGKAIMQYGSGWFKELDAQKSVIAVLDRALDHKFTLLRNVTPPGLGIMIPLILIGPSGVYVMGINHLPGLFSARGDQWGAISDGGMKLEKVNLLTRLGKMARAVQVYLQRQGYSDMNGVEAVLLCSDPSTNVDSVRPIIRVVMRDALERFAVSIAQGRVVLSPESVFDITNRLLNPPPPPKAQAVEAVAAAREESTYTPPASVLPEPEPGTPLEPIAPPEPVAPPEPLATAFPIYSPEPVPPSEPIAPAEPVPSAGSVPSDEPLFPPEAISNYEASAPPTPWVTEPGEAPIEVPPVEPPARQRKSITRKQWGFLIGLFIIWIVIVIVFIVLILKDQSLLSLFH
jgi:hypothetical protein